MKRVGGGFVRGRGGNSGNKSFNIIGSDEQLVPDAETSLAKKFAFITPEFVTNSPNGGGLATFLGRLTKHLADIGIHVHLFTPSQSTYIDANQRFETQDWNGVTVYHVHIPPLPLAPFASLVIRAVCINQFIEVMHVSRYLTDAFLEIDETLTFDVVHGADWGLTTRLVSSKPDRQVVVRASAPSAEYRKWWGVTWRPEHFLFSRAERRLFSLADLAYAPCQRTVDYYRRLGISLELIRPPYEIAAPHHLCAIDGLPSRYLLHFGNINRVKGSDWLAEALVQAWSSDDDLTMVWAGIDNEGWLTRFRQQWGIQSKRVHWLGSLNRSQMESVMRGAVAVVAPSRVDNLPNNVLEAQAAGVPVIGSRDSSIEEIVEHGTTGSLVDQDDVHSLADAMVSAWQGHPPFNQKSPIPCLLQQMKPDLAVDALLCSIMKRKPLL